MGTAFKDSALSLTEAAPVAATMSSEEVSVLFAEAARAIDELSNEIMELWP
ncbi:hypothetical protein SAMN02745157_0141 [Kaistia soli DSM 19436]|uniref:Uncharacterized protein n=1 Tax=Kaistia soli DSM 19436 TaxID=1122133 RepID=A0A1M5PE38_9HYPH|nr:hypothetical protein [Kaistia soli]SHH00066.1 hypothetical protein SAMN02745157_0141 [Kaistia soli DSM 19436]